LIVALFIVAAGFAMPSAFAGTTTTLSPATIAAGKAYATQLLSEQPVPSGATPVSHFSTPLALQSQEAFKVGNQIISRRYLIPSSVGIEDFVRGHLHRGEAVVGTGTGGGPNERTVYSVSVSLPCVSRHVTFCGLQYETTTTPSGREELRIALQIDWLPIVIVKMPTKGVVSVTGYGDNSLPQGSSDPFTVTLSHSQAVALRVDISKLKDSAGGECMEDEQLLRISVAPSNSTTVVWHATADVCPGVLAVVTKSGIVGLDDHSCALWQLVRSFFPTGKADATKGAIGFCGE
jgi:hypothetical protein